MAKSPTVPGDSILSYQGIPLYIDTGMINFLNGAADLQHAYCLPRAYFIRSVYIAVIEETSDVSAVVNMGDESDGTKYLDGYSVTDLAPGYYEVPASALTERVIPGESILLSNGVSGSVAGKLCLTIVLVPATSPPKLE